MILAVVAASHHSASFCWGVRARPSSPLRQRLLYNVGVYILTNIIYGLVALVAGPVLGYRRWRSGKWHTDWRARFGHVKPMTPVAPGQKILLIHAVSVGEVNATRLLVRKLQEQASERLRIVISTTTDTGLGRATELYGRQLTVVRFPFDFSWMVDRFLHAVQPDAVALVENEVWPNFMANCQKRQIKVCVVNGRLTSRSYRRYRWVLPLSRSMYRKLSLALVQNQEYAAHFRGLGVPADRVQVLDTMKWDTAQVVPEGKSAVEVIPGATELARAMGIDPTRPLIVAGSTAPGEDRLLIDTCPNEAQLMIVPRKPEWFAEVVKLAPDIVRRTACPDGQARISNGGRLFLLDTVGELRKAYALADLCIVGRSFLGLYGSDMMEPAALGKPVLVGPFHADFRETVEAMVAGEGLIVTTEPGAAARELLADRARAQRLADAGRRVILSRQGSTERHVQRLLQLLDIRP